MNIKQGRAHSIWLMGLLAGRGGKDPIPFLETLVADTEKLGLTYDHGYTKGYSMIPV